MSAVSTPNGLVDLAGRLTDPQDRETYAALVSFINSLPESDELFRIAQMLGLVSLVGQRIPEAAGELLAELRTQAEAAADYHRQIDARLAGLPSEIAAGVDLQVFAKGMGEAFRQQIAAAGLQDSAVVVKQFEALSDEIALAQRALAKRHSEVMATISAELAKLEAASNNLREQNTALVGHFRDESWVRPLLIGFVLLLVGGFIGMFAEKFETSDLLGDISAQIESLRRSAAPVPPPVGPAVHPRSKAK